MTMLGMLCLPLPKRFIVYLQRAALISANCYCMKFNVSINVAVFTEHQVHSMYSVKLLSQGPSRAILCKSGSHCNKHDVS